MFCLIARLLFAVGHYKDADSERIGGTGPMSKTTQEF
jgi:hypothetical protein